MLLATTGGILDAVVYLNHGHVFANAMTGNVIFLAIALTSRDFHQALRHLAPITAFLLGVLSARHLKSISRLNHVLLVLVLEIVSLFLIGFLPLTFPELLFTSIVSFISAFQVTTFRQVGHFTYNSTFVTGNLREVGEGLYDAAFDADPAVRILGRRKYRKLASICLGFLAGALLDAFSARTFPGHALWAAEPFLLIVLALILRRTPPPEPIH